MPPDVKRRALQVTVAILALIPIGAGVAGVIMGPFMIVDDMWDISMDSHYRYLSGLLLAIGIGFWTCLPAIEKKTERFALLSLIVVIGGLARSVSYYVGGAPSLSMQLGLIMELIIVPLLCLWQMNLVQPSLRRKK